MTKPESPDESYSDIGGDIHLAGCHGNVIHNATQDPLTKKPVFWFSKRIGQRNMGVAQWLLDELNKIGQIYIVDYSRDGSHPVSMKRVGDKSTSARKFITREQLHEFITSKSILR